MRGALRPRMRTVSVLAADAILPSCTWEVWRVQLDFGLIMLSFVEPSLKIEFRLLHDAGELESHPETWVARSHSPFAFKFFTAHPETKLQPRTPVKGGCCLQVTSTATDVSRRHPHG